MGCVSSSDVQGEKRPRRKKGKGKAAKKARREADRDSGSSDLRHPGRSRPHVGSTHRRREPRGRTGNSAAKVRVAPQSPSPSVVNPLGLDYRSDQAACNSSTDDRAMSPSGSNLGLDPTHSRDPPPAPARQGSTAASARRSGSHQTGSGSRRGLSVSHSTKSATFSSDPSTRRHPSTADSVFTPGAVRASGNGPNMRPKQRAVAEWLEECAVEMEEPSPLAAKLSAPPAAVPANPLWQGSPSPEGSACSTAPPT